MTKKNLLDIAAEKLLSICESGKPQDYVDLYFILAHEKYSLKTLQKAVAKKFGLKIEIENFFYDLSQTLKIDIFK